MRHAEIEKIVMIFYVFLLIIVHYYYIGACSCVLYSL